MAKRMTIMIVALVVVFGGIFGYNGVRSYFIKKHFKNFQPAPMSISAKEATATTWQPILSTVGTFTAANGINITPEVPGIVEAIYFQSGQKVRKGDLLIKLSDDVLEADLKNNQTAQTLAKVNYDRMRDLFKKGATPSSNVDVAKATLRQAEAAVEKTKAQIAQKRLHAPFDGKIGIHKLSIGQYVEAGETLTNLQALESLRIYFSLPEQYLQELKTGHQVNLKVDAYSDKKFQGKITAINAEVNPKTRNILIEATVPNEAELLYPGMFTVVDVLLEQQNAVVTVPETAVAYSLYGNSIFVIEAKGKDKDGKPNLQVFRRYVKVGERREGEVAITEGIKVGEKVVTSGQLKLQNGTRVEIGK